MPADALLVMVFALNELKGNLLLTCLEQNIRVFFEVLNKQLAPFETHIPEYLKDRVVNPEQAYRGLLKLIVQKYQGTDREFAVWFVSSIIGCPESLMCHIFRTYFET